MKSWLVAAPVHGWADVARLPWVNLVDVRALPDRSGLYIVSVCSRVLYVGIAMASLRKRWRQHHRAHVFATLTDVRVSYVEIPDGPRLWRAEEAAEDGLRPVLNGTRVGTLPPPQSPA